MLITSAAPAAANSWGSGIVLWTAHHATGTRTIALTVGSGTNSVEITQRPGTTLNAVFDNTGVVIHQRGAGASPTTVTLGSGVTIGASGTPMKQYGVHVLVDSDTNTADHSIASGATIHSTGFGLLMDARGSGDTSVTNSGSITTTAAGGNAGQKDGIRILDWTGMGGDDRSSDTRTTIENTGSVTVGGAVASGIRVDAEGRGLYRIVNNGADATVSASGTNGHGIFVNARRHTDAAGNAAEIENSGTITTTGANGFGIYVETVTPGEAHSGRGSVVVTNSGSVMSENHAILFNGNMGAVSVTHSAGTVTSKNADGIRIQQSGQGGVTVAQGGVTVAVGGDIEAAGHGILALKLGGSGTVSVTHTGGDISAGTGGGIWVQQSGTGMGPVTVASSGGEITSSLAGIAAEQLSSAGGAISVTHSGGGISVEAGNGIWVRQYGAGAVTVASSSDITAKLQHGIYVENGGTGRTAITTTGGKITADSDGIHAGIAASNPDGVAVTNAAAIDAGRYGILVWNGGGGDARIENSGAITSGSIGIQSDDDGTGDITIVNSADVTGDNHGIFARKTGEGGAVTVRHTKGEVRGEALSGISAAVGRWRDEDSADSPAPISTAPAKVEVTGGSVEGSRTHGKVAIEVINTEGSSAEADISKGATVTAMHNVGIFAYLSDRRNTEGRIRVTQAGTISARGGIFATVPRAGAEARTAEDQPLIDIVWTGSFTAATRQRVSNADSIAHAVERAQERQAKAVIRGASVHAGIDAEVLSWRILNRVATAGDDPGEIADADAQAALLDTASTDAAAKARAEAIVARFREVIPIVA